MKAFYLCIWQTKNIRKDQLELQKGLEGSLDEKQNKTKPGI